MFVFIKLGLKFVSKRSMQLGFFEFLKQVGLIFKGESANIQKITQNCITRSYIEISHKS